LSPIALIILSPILLIAGINTVAEISGSIYELI